MVNILYKLNKMLSLGMLLSFFLLSSQQLLAQNDLIKQMDSLGAILQQADSKLQDSNAISAKPLPLVKRKKQNETPQANKEAEVQSDSSAIDSLIQKGANSLKKVVRDNKQKDKELNDEGEGEITDGAKEKLEKISDLVSGDNIFYSVIFLLFGFVIIKILNFILNALAERSPSYRIAFKGAIPIIKIVTWVIIITLIIVVVFRPSITTMLAFSASIGVALGFASQDILKNVFGGIVILLDRPFVSGDKIEVDKYYGEVVEIGLRSTRIVTPDDSLVTVPNAVMMSGSVSNANSGELNCQVVAEIYLPNAVDTQEVRNLATEAASVSKFIYLGKPITILFFHEMNQNKSYLKMRVKAYVIDTRDEFKFKSDMTELIVKELVKKGVL